MERNAEDFAAKYEKVYQDMFRFALYTPVSYTHLTLPTNREV